MTDYRYEPDESEPPEAKTAPSGSAPWNESEGDDFDAALRQMEREAHRLEWAMRTHTMALRSAGVLPEHVNAHLTDFPPDVYEAAKAFLTAPQRQGLVINGPVGTGKTHLAAAIADQILRAKQRLEFVLARAVLRRVWATYHEGASETEEDVLHVYTRIPWLIVDDLGHEGRVSEAAVGAFHELLTIRNGKYKPTILTTNLDLEEIAQHYDPSIASRLGAWPQITLVGTDRRAA